MRTDPICRTDIDEGKSPHSSVFQGKTEYFCSSECKAQFEEDPSKYSTGARAEGRESFHPEGQQRTTEDIQGAMEGYGTTRTVGEKTESRAKEGSTQGAWTDERTESGRKFTEDVKAKSREFAGGVKEKTGEFVEKMKERSQPLFKNQKNRVAEKLDHVAEAFRRSGEAFSKDGGTAVSRYTDSVAEQIEHASRYIRNSDFAEMMDDAGQLVRRQPVVAFAAGVGLGFLLVRFLKSSRRAGY